ncbi:MAG TPA: hypothetical protein EYG40_06990 [Verrucomicrobia bacterium]|nr:hypothetical protein [Verrucomicrobiales bacterium]HIL54769.1 hypothetical protein [Verrucomicrobiota bacterium]
MNERRKKYQRRLKVGSLCSLIIIGFIVAGTACAFVMIKNAHVERSDVRRALLSEIKIQEKKVQTVGLRVETLRDRRALSNALKDYNSKLIPITNSHIIRAKKAQSSTSIAMKIKADTEITFINIDRPGG